VQLYLSQFPKVQTVVKKSVNAASRYVNGERVYAEEIGKWLNHEDESQDLAVQNFFVENNESAKSIKNCLIKG